MPRKTSAEECSGFWEHTGLRTHRSQDTLLPSWASRASPEEGILGSGSAPTAGNSQGGVSQELSLKPPPPLLADSLTSPQSWEVGRWALKNSHCYSPVAFKFLSLSPSLSCLWVSFPETELLLLFSSKSLNTTNSQLLPLRTTPTPTPCSAPG